MSLPIGLFLKRSGVVAHHQGHIKVIMVVYTFQILIRAGTGGRSKIACRYLHSSCVSITPGIAQKNLNIAIKIGDGKQLEKKLSHMAERFRRYMR